MSRPEPIVVGGTAQTPGAVLLAGEAALRAGAGKLSVAAPEPVAVALAVAAPESLVAGVQVTDDEGASVALLEALAGRITAPLVVDALA